MCVYVVRDVDADASARLPRGHEAEDNNPFSLLTLVIIQHQYHGEGA